MVDGIDGARAREIALRLTSWPSVSRTQGEVDFASKLRSLLSDMLGAGAVVRSLPVAEGDARASVLAHVPGAGRRAVLLCGHFDTVPTDDYGALRPLALEGEALARGLSEALADDPAAAQVLADLADGAFLPGRGLLDMKAGLAAGMTVAEDFAARAARDGHVLFLATPDEEVDSLGVRSAIPQVRRYCAENDLDLALAVNLDALTDRGDGAQGRSVAFGCVGKVLLSALVVGKETHACYPFDGVSAGHVGAALAVAMECAPELAGGADGEPSAPPTLLAGRDLKPVYNVTTPASAWYVWNVIVQDRSFGEVFDISAGIARRVVDECRAAMTARARAQPVPTTPSPAWEDMDVIGFDALLEQARAREPSLDAALGQLCANLRRDPDMDTPTLCRRLTERTVEAAGSTSPIVVLGFASTPYFPTRFPGEAAALRDAVTEAVAGAREEAAVSIRLTDHLPIISDMSFLGDVDPADLETAAGLTPAWGHDIDPASMATLGVPAINAGPWGRDYHHAHERVAADYAFRILPRLVGRIVDAALRR